MDSGGLFYLILVACGFLVIMLVVSVGFSYWWLVSLDAQGRKCPNCGKKGAGNLLSSDTLSADSYTKWSRPRGFAGMGGRPQLMEVTEKNYEDHYECQQCGHRWSKAGKETTVVPIAKEDERAKTAKRY
jgi:hypothetical protein